MLEHKHALHFAVLAGDETLVRHLLESGADVNDVADVSEHGRNLTPLHLAAKLAQTGIATALLDAGADADALGHLTEDRVADGYRTPLDFACESGHKAIVKLLLKDTSDVERLLHLAAASDNPSILGLVLDFARAEKWSLDLDLGLGDDKDTCLHTAARYGRLAAIKALLEAGADPLVMNADYDQPDDVAAGEIRSELDELVQPYRNKVWEFEAECERMSGSVIDFLGQYPEGAQIAMSEIAAALATSREVVLEVIDSLRYTRQLDIEWIDGVPTVRILPR